MTENRAPATRPDVEWLERAIERWDSGLTWPRRGAALSMGERHTLAEHILGNWLTIEDAQVPELVEYRGRFGLPLERDLYWKPIPLSQV